ncbi:hypothetical protein AB0M11_26510 [Streptomyces sp. NPDC051987]|uniref:hypothetical protein n=1 Tax=Streptomyces sp. NPDC051987 TaxID=3155808 RepID=UPI003421029D
MGEHLPPWLTSEIRPVLAFTGAGRALAIGSHVLARRAWHTLGEHLSGLERLGALAGGGYVTVYCCAQAPHIAEFAAPGAVVAWCVAAWWVAPPAPATPEQPAEEEPAVEQRPAPEDVRAATLDWIRERIGDRQGVHLRDLLEHAQAHGMFEGLDVSGLRGHLERWQIPVRDRVRVRGLGVTVGVYRDDLPPFPDRDSQDPPNPELHAA